MHLLYAYTFARSHCIWIFPHFGICRNLFRHSFSVLALCCYSQSKHANSIIFEWMLRFIRHLCDIFRFFSSFSMFRAQQIVFLTLAQLQLVWHFVCAHSPIQNMDRTIICSCNLTRFAKKFSRNNLSSK